MKCNCGPVEDPIYCGECDGVLYDPSSHRNKVLEEVSLERDEQENKWGEQNHPPADYLMILGEEVGEANKAALEAKFMPPEMLGTKLSEYREELIQVAAVAVAMVECLDRGKWK